MTNEEELAVIEAAVQEGGPFAHAGEPRQVAIAWRDEGFGAEDVTAWLAAECFSPRAARQLTDLGVCPRAASSPVECCGIQHTLGFLVSNGEFTIADARSAIKEGLVSSRLHAALTLALDFMEHSPPEARAAANALSSAAALVLDEHHPVGGMLLCQNATNEIVAALVECHPAMRDIKWEDARCTVRRWIARLDKLQE